MPHRLAALLADYRSDDGYSVDVDHVERWLAQFPANDRAAVCDESFHVFQQTYFSRERLDGFLNTVLTKLGGADETAAASFWRGATLLEVQPRSASQKILNERLRTLARARYHITIGDSSSGMTAIYLDDIACSGRQVRNDLATWIADKKPNGVKIQIVNAICHRSGYWALRDIEKRLIGSNCVVEWLAALTIEDRLSRRNTSQILWPSLLPQTPELTWYLENAARGVDLKLRTPPSSSSTTFFSSEVSRQTLESQFLNTGARIYRLPANPNAEMRPLGYKQFPGLGFGTMVATHLNCPNNAPLALWWGHPGAPGPIGQWYPLLERRTRQQG